MRPRSRRTVAAGAAILLTVAPAAAGDWGCRECWPGARVIYAPPNFSYVQPNYIVQPNYVVQPTYIVRPTYVSRPVYLIVPPPSYVLDPSDARPPIYIVNQGPTYTGPNITTFALPTYSEGGYAYAKPYPYIGRWRWHRAYAPYAAYRYRPAANARVINVPPRYLSTSLR